MKSSTAIVPGSLSAISARSGGSLAESFVSSDVIVICDTSGSMASKDSRGGKSRYDVACEELAKLQANMPGKIAVLAFSSDVEFCPGGVPRYFGGGTALHRALKFAKVADVPGMRFIVISDGQPDDESAALREAQQYKARIDVIYVGPENDLVRGRDFLERLAQASGGTFVTAKCAELLAEKTERLLLSDISKSA